MLIFINLYFKPFLSNMSVCVPFNRTETIDVQSPLFVFSEKVCKIFLIEFFRKNKSWVPYITVHYIKPHYLSLKLQFGNNKTTEDQDFLMKELEVSFLAF